MIYFTIYQHRSIFGHFKQPPVFGGSQWRQRRHHQANTVITITTTDGENEVFYDDDFVSPTTSLLVSPASLSPSNSLSPGRRAIHCFSFRNINNKNEQIYKLQVLTF